MTDFNPRTFRYRDFIQDNFSIVNKSGALVSFQFNAVQNQYLVYDYTGTDDILKARQQGFSSLIDAIFTTDFLLRPHSYSVIVADIEENATGLLDRVKIYLESYSEKTGVSLKQLLKYDSRFELYNKFMDSRFIIGTAKNVEFGRSKTIHNLHLSEVAFYPHIDKLIAGAGQAVVEGGRKIFETTANGFNDYKVFRGQDNGFKKIFYPGSKFYSKEFLEKKKKELGRLFPQEYPETEIEAFITSGDCYFNQDSLREYLAKVQDPGEFRQLAA